MNPSCRLPSPHAINDARRNVIVSTAVAETSTAASQPVAEPIRLQYGSLRLKSRYLLAPLAGFTNLPFRRVCHQLGGLALGTTDLVNAQALVLGNEKTLHMIETHAEDSPFSVQIFGADPAIMRDAAQLLEERGNVDAVDINMGCPVDRITKGGAGSAMMCTSDTIDLVRNVVEATKLPVTVKMRLGWDETQLTSPKFAHEFEQVGVKAVMIHGRTRAQGFSGSVDLDGIRATVEACESIPVIGNGDVRTVADAEHMFSVTGCNGISVGRGALANPWIFRQLVEYETTGSFGPAGTFRERLKLMKRQFGYLAENREPHRALVMFRKMAHWYLKAMRVKPSLRHQVQTVKTIDEFYAVLDRIDAAGPTVGTKDGTLPDMYVPVPKGPVERW